MAFRESLGMRLRSAYLSMHRCFQAHCDKFGVTADQFVVLTLLAEEDGIIQKELVRRTYSDANTIAALVGLLEKKGLVRRIRHEDDGRAWCVYLTPQGRRRQRELARSTEALHRQLREAVSPEDMPTLLRCLQRIAEVMAPPRESKKNRVPVSTRSVPCA